MLIQYKVFAKCCASVQHSLDKLGLSLCSSRWKPFSLEVCYWFQIDEEECGMRDSLLLISLAFSFPDLPSQLAWHIEGMKRGQEEGRSGHLVDANRKTYIHPCRLSLPPLHFQSDRMFPSSTRYVLFIFLSTLEHIWHYQSTMVNLLLCHCSSPLIPQNTVV